MSATPLTPADSQSEVTTFLAPAKMDDYITKPIRVEELIKALSVVKGE